VILKKGSRLKLDTMEKKAVWFFISIKNTKCANFFAQVKKTPVLSIRNPTEVKKIANSGQK
jgi:hypothetical protein